MNDCRLCGRRFDGPVCPACGTPAAEPAGWAPPPSAPETPATLAFGVPYAQQPAPDPQAPGAYPGYDAAGYPLAAQGSPQPAYGGYGAADQGYAAYGGAEPGYAGYGAGDQAYPAEGGGYMPAPARPVRRSWLPVLIAVLALAVVGVGVLLALKVGLGAATATPAPTPRPVQTVAPATAGTTTPPAAQASTPAPVTVPTNAAAPVAPPAPQSLTEQQALSMLTTQASQDKASYGALHARGVWLAQLSSKYVGVTDPLQAAPVTGGSTYTARDIYAHYLQLKAQWTGASLILIDTRALAAPESAPGGGPKWRVYVADPTFASQSAADAWCASRLPQLSGETLRNFCQAQRP